MVRKTALIVSLAIVLGGSPATAQNAVEKQAIALMSRPAKALEPLMQVSGDEMDTSIKVSSYDVSAITSKGLLFSRKMEPTFLRAFIDKKTGAVSMQIYHVADYYSRSSWRFYNRATVEGPSGPLEATVERVSSDVNCSGARNGGCSFSEDLTIALDEANARAAAAAYVPGSATGLRFRLNSQSGEKIDDLIPGNELVAFMAVVDREVDKVKQATKK